MRAKITAILILMMTNFVCEAQDGIFVDCILKRLIEEAIENNSSLQIAELNVEQAEIMLSSARLTYLPSFVFTPSVSMANPLAGEKNHSYALPVTMSWEFSLGGREKGEKTVAKANLQQLQEEYRYTKVLIASSVANAYYTLVMLDWQKSITQESIINQEATLSVIQALKQVGRMDEIAVNQAESRLQAIRISIGEFELQISKVETALSLLLGRQAGEIERNCLSDVLPPAIDPAKPIELQQLSQRPDVLAAEYALKKACGNLTIAKSELYPKIKIDFEGGWSNYIGAVVEPQKLISSLIGSLTQPVFDRKRLVSDKKVAELQVKQARSAFEYALMSAAGELRDAIAECKNAQCRQILRQKQVEAAEKAFENSKLMLSCSQTMTYMDILSAQDLLLTAKMQQAADFLEYQQALISLYKALCCDN